MHLGVLSLGIRRRQIQIISSFSGEHPPAPDLVALIIAKLQFCVQTEENSWGAVWSPASVWHYVSCKFFIIIFNK